MVRSPLRADPPVLSYLFPAGGQRGTTVTVRVGGLYLHDRCGFDLAGRGVSAPPEIHSTGRVWFEGPVLPLPDSQQPEDYPLDMAATVRLATDAPPGVVRARLWTSQGIASGPGFVVGDLPEVVEAEIAGDPVPMPVTLPVTANGRVFPREDLDVWAVTLKRGETVTALAVALGIGSPLAPRLEVFAPDGSPLAESGPVPVAGADASVRFTAPADGVYHVRVGDARNQGGPAHVYRLTLTAGPVVDHVFPLGGRRGTAPTAALTGQAVPAAPVTVPLPKDGPAGFTHRFATPAGPTAPVPLDLDNLPEHVAPAAGPVAVPAVLNGRIASADAPDRWAVSLAKGKRYTLELRARKLGSPLYGVLTVLDPAGKEVARADGGADVTADPTLAFQAPADGTYTVRVGERFRGRGGPAFAYRLRVTAAPTPDFRLTLVGENKTAGDTLAVPRGGSAKLKVTAERVGGLTGAIVLTAAGLPPGLTAAPATIAAGQTTAELAVTAAADANVQPGKLVVTGEADADVTVLTRRAAYSNVGAVPGGVEVAVVAAVPTPFTFDGDFTSATAPRGQVYHRTYRLERKGFAGPVEVRLADRQGRHLQGMTASPVTVPAGATTFGFAVSLPPWAELGRTCRGCLMATGVVVDPDGTRHPVCFTSNAQNHQVIIVAEPGRLGLELGTTTVRAEPGREVRVPVRVGRAKGLTGPVTVALDVPAHWAGVTADPVTVPADRADGHLTVRFAAGAAGPFNMPATVSATLTQNADPVTASADLVILAP